MDQESRLIAIEESIKLIRADNDARREMIHALCEQIDIIHAEMDKLVEDNGSAHDSMSHRQKVAEEIQDIIGEKLFTIFYKVFPEAVEVDDALERAVKAQRKR
jgi:hypothetical protein